MSIMGYNNDDDWSNLLMRNSLSEFEKPCLPPTSFPFFKDVATGAILRGSGYDFDDWSNLPVDILILIIKKFSFLREYYRFIAVCKSWRDSVSEFKKPCLPLTEYPFLLLAEDVAPGAMLDYDSSQDHSRVEEEDDDDDDDDEEEEDSGEDDDEEEEDSGEDDDDDGDDLDDSGNGGGDSGDDDNEEDNSGDNEEDSDKTDYIVEENGDKIDYTEEDEYDHNKISVGSSRGLYSFLTGKTYYIDLPEAAGRLILGTNKGWLVTLGRDLQINLLHPLLNHQISLPPMLTFPRQMPYHEDYMPEDASDMFIQKVVVSSSVLSNNTAFGLYYHHASPSPYVMAIYGDFSSLGFARLGDKVWRDVDVPSFNFEDIVYHKGNFYAVDCYGNIFVCGSNNDEEGGDIRGTKIAKIESKDWDKKYLVEPTSGSGLLLLVRYRKELQLKYRTTDFSVWRLDLNYSVSFEDISCSLKEENDLGNEAIFVGRASSTAVSSSEIIKPNFIYFTDDYLDGYYHKGGGHDMGIFSMERHTIEPHFQGKSYHPISPPLWYI